MYLGEFTETTLHKRTSKTGLEHEYYRTKTLLQLRCDNCDREFTRSRGSMDPKRLSNNYFHVCDNCDSKRFAQKTGVQKKKIWELKASSNLPIGKF